MVELQRVYEHHRTHGTRFLVERSRGGDVVLLYSSHDAEHNNAVVLRYYVNEKFDQDANEPANAASGHGGRGRGR